MSHNIHFNEQTSRHSFFSVKEKAWHGLGQVVSDYPNSSEALRFAGLDFEVQKQPIFVASQPEVLSPGDAKVVESHMATVRTDSGDVLGIVGKDYEVVQNRDAFAFFDNIVGGDGIFYETAGALGKGERIFITAKLPSYIRVGADDLVEQYLFLTTSHNGYGSITAAFTPVRIVCQNTLNAALHRQSQAIRIRHTSHAKETLAEAHKLMGITNQLSSQLEEIFNRWSRITIHDDQLKKLVQKSLAPAKSFTRQLAPGQVSDLSTQLKNQCEQAMEYAGTDATQQMPTTRGTLFGAYNAVTGFLQHIKKYQHGEARLKSMMFGGNAQQKTQVAFDLCSRFEKEGAWALN